MLHVDSHQYGAEGYGSNGQRLTRRARWLCPPCYDRLRSQDPRYIAEQNRIISAQQTEAWEEKYRAETKASKRLWAKEQERRRLANLARKELASKDE